MTRAQAFKVFLKHFSKETLPITLSDENISYFDLKNRPLSGDVIRQFILQGQPSPEEDVAEEDEMTEYIACNIIPDTKNFYAVVYWKGMLLEYDYILATYNKNGVLLSRKVIAGLRSDGQNVRRSVATIDEDWIISIVAGEQVQNEKHYNPLKSKIITMELMANGEIIFALDADD